MKLYVGLFSSPQRQTHTQTHIAFTYASHVSHFTISSRVIRFAKMWIRTNSNQFIPYFSMEIWSTSFNINSSWKKKTSDRQTYKQSNKPTKGTAPSTEPSENNNVPFSRYIVCFTNGFKLLIVYFDDRLRNERKPLRSIRPTTTIYKCLFNLLG